MYMQELTQLHMYLTYLCGTELINVIESIVVVDSSYNDRQTSL